MDDEHNEIEALKERLERLHNLPSEVQPTEPTLNEVLSAFKAYEKGVKEESEVHYLHDKFLILYESYLNELIKKSSSLINTFSPELHSIVHSIFNNFHGRLNDINVFLTCLKTKTRVASDHVNFTESFFEEILKRLDNFCRSFDISHEEAVDVVVPYLNILITISEASKASH